MISSPLILAGIYTHNREAVYYFSSLMAVMNMVIMTIFACRKDSKTLGKTSIDSEGDKDVATGTTSIELPVVEKKEEKEKVVEENVEEKKNVDNGEIAVTAQVMVVIEQKQEEKNKEDITRE